MELETSSTYLNRPDGLGRTSSEAQFAPLRRCWICQGTEFKAVHRGIYEFSVWREQDPELAEYTGRSVVLNRCRRCGFGQPNALPTLPNYFDRIYDQQWSDEWVEAESVTQWKDMIFDSVLDELERRLPAGSPRRLLDVGAHAGRFIHLAQQRGWTTEGVELNPRTAACAARKTGAMIHRVNVHALALQQRQYEAVTLTDVLEHIPEPLTVLESMLKLLVPGGWVAIKVPHGSNQLRKENLRSRLRPGYRAVVMDNLVHINHFTPGSLRRAIETVGYTNVRVVPGAPELMPTDDCRTLADRATRWFRQGVYRAASLLPFGVHTPLSMNLQAYAQKA